MPLKLSGKRLTRVIIIAAAVVISGIVAWYFLKPPAVPDGLAYGNGRLEATETAIASKIQGKLIEVRFREGADLKEGEIGALLDGEDVKAQLRAAEANLISARESARETRESLKSAISEQKLAVATYKRTEELIKKNFISEAQLDKDRTTLQTANSTLAGAKNRVAEADAAVEAAAANVDALKVSVDDTILRVPVDGRVLYRLAEPGEVISAGGRVLAMIDLSDVYMYVYLNTEEAGKVVMGDEARIVLDALPDVQIPAHIAFVAPKNQFTPKEVETQEERVKFMFRVKVKVNRDWLEKNSNVAKPGMPGIGWVKIKPGTTWPATLPQPSR
ncbi:HlyD family efflux transporter periplasmic adaptor subunit [Oxalobacter vibrioformis]|uniref:HlyD family efflux transporter periplasmic adaptor subunit n=1 Tax=Oxalobacter vibrioformis TaxID=933080 RepID=A0A9E9LW52_9BURK|nr:HlyD family efflux transporter periplasmic adaptor subunit [Oxalobacter vibrioformis]WAW10326.1 HlyD family efflux transporter periplasmic adaptor subunit [Oxalobacter vibrioformis]